MIVLFTSPVRSASSARVSALSPLRNAVRTDSARSTADTPDTEEASLFLPATRQAPTISAMLAYPGYRRQPVNLAGRAAEQGCFLLSRIPDRKPFEGVPDRSVRGHALIHRKVALEHAALRAEPGDAAFD